MPVFFVPLAFVSLCFIHPDVERLPVEWLNGSSDLHPARWASAGSRSRQPDLPDYGRGKHLQDDVGFLQATGEVRDSRSLPCRYGRSLEKVGVVLCYSSRWTAVVLRKIRPASNAGQASSG